MASVDVVVPCYNYAHYLEGCLASILSQRDVQVRVLILDDCSPDDTETVARRLAAADPRVEYQRNAQNLGLIGTANRGVMDWARADYVVLLSADDALTPGALARACDLMDANPQISLTYGMALMMSDEGAPLCPPDVREPDTRIVSSEAFLREVCRTGNPVPTPTAVMRTSVQHAVGPYDPRFKHTSDLDTWMRAASQGPIGVVNAIQGLYRWHATNMSAAYQRRPIGDREEVLKTCVAFAERYGRNFPAFAGWLAEMEAQFGREALQIASDSFSREGDDTWEGSLAFARAHGGASLRSPAALKFLAKRLIGRKAVLDRVRRRAAPASPDHGPAWYDHGMQIGWWPTTA